MRTQLPPRYRYVLAILAIAVVAGIDLTVKFFVNGYVPMSLFLSAIVFASWIGGRVPGLIATALGALAEIMVFMPPTAVLTSQAEVLRLSIYFVQGLAISLIFGKFHEAEQRHAQTDRLLINSLANEKEARMRVEESNRILKKNEEEIREARKNADEANKVKSLFLANMSHEIRTPLGAILGYAELLKEKDLPAEERTHFLTIIERTAVNLTEIINDILDISKVEAGHLELEHIYFSPADVISEVCEMFGPKCAEKGISLSMTQQGSISKLISADPQRLRQILINLVSNAIKFTSKGSVRIRVQDTGSQLDIVVTDTGIGMSPEQAARLFENFYQGDNSISRKFAGTGLGLALSRRLARAMGGDIQVVETAPGKGSSFRATIGYTSVKEFKMAQSTESATPSDVLEKYPGRRALVVDDALDNRFLLARILKKMEFSHVATANDGKEALDELQSQKYDVIFMDMQMPVMDGYEATSELVRQGCSSKIIALTANAMKEDRDRCLAAGCHGYMTKPIRREDLVAALNSALGSANSQGTLH